MKKQNKALPRKIPSPDELLAKAEAVADGFNLGDYRLVMHKLRAKGMTFRGIAAWLSKELERPITHTQVFRMMQLEPAQDALEHDNLLAAELRDEDQLEEKKGDAR